MSKLMTSLFILSAVLFVGTHLFFLRTFLYYEYDHIDILMHVWGGALVVMSWYVGLSLFRAHPARCPYGAVLWLLFLIVVWEIFKYLIGSTVADGYVLDTAIDVVAGLGGGLVVFWLYHSRTMSAS